tara:strand:+ start:340 stop:534 length:195 start_codon:yes stop_codon:yes gene_type:complete
MEEWFKLNEDNPDNKYSLVRHVYRRAIWMGAGILAVTIAYPLSKLQDFIENTENKLENLLGNKK